MASEVKRGFVRVLSNYLRIISSVVLGLLLVPLLLRAVGEDGYAVVALFGSTIGLAAMFQEIVRASMIREVGAAYHGGDEGNFIRTYNSALALSGLVALAALAMFTILWFAVPLFKLDNMDAGGRAMVAARGLETAVTIALAPAFNMYLVSERMVAYNFWMLAVKQISQVAGAVWLLLPFVDYGSAVDGLIIFAWSSSSLMIAGTVLSVIVITLVDRRLIPAPRFINRRDVRSIVGIGGWNAAVVAAMNLHYRVDAIIMNLAFGLFGSQIFGYAVQLTSAARRLVVGMTDGLDAVSARVTAENADEVLRSLVHHATRLHGMVAFPAGVALLLLVEPFLHLWLGERLSDPSRVIPPTVLLIQVLTVGIVVRGVSDGWVRILYGAGHIRKYAPHILAGGLLNPLLAVALIAVLPTGVAEVTAVAWSFTAIMVVVHGVIVAGIGAGVLGVRRREMFTPLIRPLLVALGSAPVLLGAHLLFDAWSVWQMLAAVLAYGAVYAAGTAIVTLTARDRRILINGTLRRLGRKPAAVATDPIDDSPANL